MRMEKVIELWYNNKKNLKNKKGILKTQDKSLNSNMSFIRIKYVINT